MKKSTILITLFLIVQIGAMSQPCLPEGIEFNNQIEIDNFQINYPDCTEIEGNVTISGVEITNLDGLSNLKSIGGYFVVQNNYMLSNLVGLDSLSSVGSLLRINNNSSLNSLSGLDALSTIQGSLVIKFNNSLADLTGLNSISSISDVLYIGSNDNLVNLSGLESLKNIGTYLEIRNNEALVSLNGLESLTTIGGDLWIYDNNALTNIMGLGALSSIGGEIFIGANYNLTSLAGIDNINANSIQGIHISYNESLSNCDATSICDFLANPLGQIDIQYNSAGCNTPQEVEYACENVWIQEIGLDLDFTIYPNPTKKRLSIISNSGAVINEINILNALGKTVLHNTETTLNIDLSTLQKGIYFIEMVVCDKTIREKLIVN